MIPTWSVWLFAIGMAYLWGREGQRLHEFATRRKRQKRRDWLAAKIMDLRLDLQIRDNVVLELLAERDELLKERASAHPEMN